MIRCDLYKGKTRLFGNGLGLGAQIRPVRHNNNFVEAARDAQPRTDDPGVVVDRGNVGQFR